MSDWLLWGASLVLALLSKVVRKTDHDVVTLFCIIIACAIGYGLATFSFINMLQEP
ncbi:hypothetical protein [Citrobacter sp. wls827]|uniref:hypothetical protein n=1 Tax=Citrobacter TaxID=544 RepID=UPI00148539AD|nr:hypothetical protein [Citrobacter sp. wls827]